MAKVTIWHEPQDFERDSGRSAITVKVDGETVGGGSFGGEPEDNMELRDYAWVRPLIESLAKALGAEVETRVSERLPASAAADPPMTVGERVMFGERPALQPAFEITYRVEMASNEGANITAVAIHAAAEASGAEDRLALALWTEGGPGAGVENGRVVLSRVTDVPRG